MTIGAASKLLSEKGRRADEPGAKLGINNGAVEIRCVLTIGCFP